MLDVPALILFVYTRHTHTHTHTHTHIKHFYHDPSLDLAGCESELLILQVRFSPTLFKHMLSKRTLADRTIVTRCRMMLHLI